MSPSQNPSAEPVDKDCTLPFWRTLIPPHLLWADLVSLFLLFSLLEKLRLWSSWQSIRGQQACLWSVYIIFHSEFKYCCKVIKIIHDFICAKRIITLSTLIFIMQKYAELNIFCWAGKTVYSVVTLFFIKFCTRLKRVWNLITKGSIQKHHTKQAIWLVQQEIIYFKPINI